MDRQRALIKLIALAAVAFLGAAAQPPQKLRAQGWTAPGPMLAHDLTHAPKECLASTTPDVEIGRALFRSPALLGGPAARLGLSCNACHANGRVNARFLLPELTNRPGAADVTSEWASRVRGDGIMNPVDIPDLAGANARETFGRARDASLAHFIQGVIEDEFQGRRPPQQAFDGVISYVRALDLEQCGGVEALTLAGAADDVRRALSAATTADADTASLLVLAAQDALGRIVERLPRAGFSRERRRLENLARELGALRGDDIQPALEASLPGWRARFDAAIMRIARREHRTYFNEATLARALTP